nr:hypothetical protein Iba_chr15aCG11680 [Ipomoea batatas]
MKWIMLKLDACKTDPAGCSRCYWDDVPWLVLEHQSTNAGDAQDDPERTLKGDPKDERGVAWKTPQLSPPPNFFLEDGLMGDKEEVGVVSWLSATEGVVENLCRSGIGGFSAKLKHPVVTSNRKARTHLSRFMIIRACKATVNIIRHILNTHVDKHFCIRHPKRGPWAANDTLVCLSMWNYGTSRRMVSKIGNPSSRNESLYQYLQRSRLWVLLEEIQWSIPFSITDVQINRGHGH